MHDYHRDRYYVIISRQAVARLSKANASLACLHKESASVFLVDLHCLDAAACNHLASHKHEIISITRRTPTITGHCIRLLAITTRLGSIGKMEMDRVRRAVRGGQMVGKAPSTPRIRRCRERKAKSMQVKRVPIYLLFHFSKDHAVSTEYTSVMSAV